MGAPELLIPDWTVPDNVVARVTTRAGGISQPPFASLNLAQHVGDVVADVEANRLAVALELDGVRGWQWLDQVHGTTVTRVTSPSPAIVSDALVTAEPGLACCVLTADCLSVFLADRSGTEVAVAHAGWRGLVAGILENTVQAMSTPPERLVAWMGPAIGPCHFEVGREVYEAFLHAAGAASRPQVAACFRPAADSEHFYADLFALAQLRLRALGVAAISGGGSCTYCEQDRFYSYRREHPTGRHLSVIYLKS